MDVEFANGTVATTLTRGDFTEIGNTHTASYEPPESGDYTARLVAATDDAGNDGAAGRTDTANVNDPPTADFTYSTFRGFARLDGIPSSDPDGTIESYEWDYGNDGDVDATGPSAYTDTGQVVRLIVTDDDGATDEVVVLVE